MERQYIKDYINKNHGHISNDAFEKADGESVVISALSDSTTPTLAFINYLINNAYFTLRDNQHLQNITHDDTHPSFSDKLINDARNKDLKKAQEAALETSILYEKVKQILSRVLKGEKSLNNPKIKSDLKSALGKIYDLLSSKYLAVDDVSHVDYDQKKYTIKKEIYGYNNRLYMLLPAALGSRKDFINRTMEEINRMYKNKSASQSYSNDGNDGLEKTERRESQPKTVRSLHKGEFKSDIIKSEIRDDDFEELGNYKIYKTTNPIEAIRYILENAHGTVDKRTQKKYEDTYTQIKELLKQIEEDIKTVESKNDVKKLYDSYNKVMRLIGELKLTSSYVLHYDDKITIRQTDTKDMQPRAAIYLGDYLPAFTRYICEQNPVIEGYLSNEDYIAYNQDKLDLEIRDTEKKLSELAPTELPASEITKENASKSLDELTGEYIELQDLLTKLDNSMKDGTPLTNDDLRKLYAVTGEAKRSLQQLALTKKLYDIELKLQNARFILEREPGEKYKELQSNLEKLKKAKAEYEDISLFEVAKRQKKILEEHGQVKSK